MDEPESRRGPLRRTLKKLAVSLGSLFVLLLAAEGVTRLFFEAPPELETLVGPQYVRAVESPIGREMIPGVKSAWHFPGCAYNEDKTVPLSINEHGLRGRSFPAEKAEGVTRVLCIGDSMTFGTGVADEEAWPAVLQGLLEARRERVEVWNCGVEGTNTLEQGAFLEQRLLGLEPDLVVLSYYVNDAQLGEGPKVPHSRLDKLLLRFAGNDPARLAKELRSVSRLAELLARRLWVRVSMKQYNAKNRQPYTAGSGQWKTVQAELRRIRDLCAARGSGFCMVLHPTLQREGEHLATHEAYRHVQAFCEEEGIACLDLEPALLPLPVEELWVGPLNMHPGAELDRVTARAIGDFLLDEGLLPAGR